MHQAGGRGKRHVGREGAEDNEVDVARIDVGVGDAADGGLVAQVAGRLVRRGVAAFEDAGALDDPVGVEAETVEQVLVGDDRFRDVVTGSQNAHPHQTPAARTRKGGAFFTHEIGPPPRETEGALVTGTIVSRSRTVQDRGSGIGNRESVNAIDRAYPRCCLPDSRFPIPDSRFPTFYFATCST